MVVDRRTESLRKYLNCSTSRYFLCISGFRFTIKLPVWCDLTCILLLFILLLLIYKRGRKRNYGYQLIVRLLNSTDLYKITEQGSAAQKLTTNVMHTYVCLCGAQLSRFYTQIYIGMCAILPPLPRLISCFHMCILNACRMLFVSCSWMKHISIY